jgi:serine/threonine-protein kinase
MAKWGIQPGDKNPGTLDTEGRARAIAVNEGEITVYVLGDFEELPAGTALSGRLIFGDRVFGRLTQAQTPKGKAFPVCFELHDIEGGRGLVRERNGGSDTVKVFTSVDVRAVRRFE